MTTLSCKVTSVEAITDTVYRVRLVPDAAFFIPRWSVFDGRNGRA